MKGKIEDAERRRQFLLNRTLDMPEPVPMNERARYTSSDKEAADARAMVRMVVWTGVALVLLPAGVAALTIWLGK